MNTHDNDIELPPLPPHPAVVNEPGPPDCQFPRLYRWAEAYARAAIEADRQRRGEPVGEIHCRIYHGTEQHRDYLKARFHPDTSWKNRVSFEWQGHRWAYRYTHFDDSGEYDLIVRPAPQPAESCASLISDKTACGSDKGDCDSQPAEPVTCFKCGHPTHRGECVNVAPQPAEPDSAKCAECGAEMIHIRPGKWQHPDCPQSPWAAEPVSTHHVHRGVESLPCYCKGKDDHPIGKETLEPVKVPSDDDIRRVARDMYLAGDLVWLGFDKDENGEYTQPKISRANITLIRALLARYGQHAQPAKSSLSVSYDGKGDCLYVVCDSNEPADAEEDDKGILYRRAISDGRLVGITITNFMGQNQRTVYDETHDGLQPQHLTGEHRPDHGSPA